LGPLASLTSPATDAWVPCAIRRGAFSPCTHTFTCLSPRSFFFCFTYMWAPSAGRLPRADFAPWTKLTTRPHQPPSRFGRGCCTIAVTYKTEPRLLLNHLASSLEIPRHRERAEPLREGRGSYHTYESTPPPPKSRWKGVEHHPCKWSLAVASLGDVGARRRRNSSSESEFSHDPRRITSRELQTTFPPR
jgi:hypothetical protein